MEEKCIVALYSSHSEAVSVSEKMVSEGLTLTAKQSDVNELIPQMHSSNNFVKLVDNLRVSQESMRRSRVDMWRYKDIGDDDERE